MVDEAVKQPETPPVSPAIRVEGTTDLLGEIIGDDSFDMSWDITPNKRISMMLSDADASDDEESSLVCSVVSPTCSCFEYLTCSCFEYLDRSVEVPNKC